MDEKELAKIGKKVMKIVVEKRKNPTVGEVIGVGMLTMCNGIKYRFGGDIAKKFADELDAFVNSEIDKFAGNEGDGNDNNDN